MSPVMLVYIALGGAIGAVSRFLLTSLSGHWFGHGFPFGTIIVNVLGAFALGALVEVMALAWSPSQEVRAFLVVGLLGSFTTFSAFSLDAVTMIDRGQIVMPSVYIGCSVVVSILAFYSGLTILRQILS
jgi:CrcB protein